jgi:hypothetical protein
MPWAGPPTPPECMDAYPNKGPQRERAKSQPVLRTQLSALFLWGPAPRT